MTHAAAAEQTGPAGDPGLDEGVQTGYPALRKGSTDLTRRSIRQALAGGVVMSLVLASGCGWRYGGGRLKRNNPPRAAFVGDVTVAPLPPPRPPQNVLLRAPPPPPLFLCF